MKTISEKRKSASKNQIERGKFRREECSPKAANLRDYIEHKGNRNVSITTSTMAGLPKIKQKKKR